MRKLTAFIAVAVLGATVAASVAAAGPSGDTRKFCKTYVAINAAFGADELDVEKVNRLLDRLAETAPPEIADAVDVAVPAFQADPEGAFEDPAVDEAVGQMDEFVATSCGYEQIDVGLEEYAFVGIPDEIEKGTVVFTLTNEGAELHEIAVYRLKGDATLDDLVEAEEGEDVEGEDEFEDLAVEVGGGFAAPGESTYALVPLKKTGNYVALCFLPVGATDEPALEAAEEAGAPPHLAEGMAAEFEVTS